MTVKASLSVANAVTHQLPKGVTMIEHSPIVPLCELISDFSCEIVSDGGVKSYKVTLAYKKSGHVASYIGVIPDEGWMGVVWYHLSDAVEGGDNRLHNLDIDLTLLEIVRGFVL